MKAMSFAACVGVLGLAAAGGCGAGGGERATETSGSGSADAGAAGGGGQSEEGRDPVAPEGELLGEWRLGAIGGEALQLGEAVRAPTLMIRETGDAGGFGGVNRWGSLLDLDAAAEGEFRLAKITSTLMAGPREAMELERRYFDALRAAASFDRKGLAEDRLVVRDAAGAEVLRFSRSE